MNQAMDVKYPRLFAKLRAAGWSLERSVPLPPAELAPGMASNDYADDFLRMFGGISVCQQDARVTGIPRSKRIDLGFDARIERLDLSVSVLWIYDMVGGDSCFYPVFDTGTGVAFILEDGRTMLLSDTFRAYAWTPDPFVMMDWLLFETPVPGLEMQYIPKDDRPPDFYDYD